MNVGIHRPTVRALVAVVMLLGLALATSASASTGKACLLNDGAKVCVELGSQPAESVQPSGLAGTPTYVHYTALLTNASLKSTRFVEMRLNLEPATGFTKLVVKGGAQCSIAGSQLYCKIDKITIGEPTTIEVTANAPPDRGDQTADKLVNTAVFGWQGRTATTSSTVSVDAQSGSTYVPPNQTVTLVTADETTDPSEQVTTESPLWGKMTLPPRPEGYYARIAVIQDGPDGSAQCVGGMFHAPDGGPYVCRDPDNPGRWIFTELPDDSFTPDSPVQFTVMWDASIVPAAQLPPSEAFPTGAPEFAIFYNQTEVGVPYGRTRAFANVCETTPPVAPCIQQVERFDNGGDWRANFLKANDGSDMDPMQGFRKVLDYLIRVAYAGPITVGPVAK